MDCRYNIEDIEKIMGFTSWSDKKKIDTLLHIDCNMYTQLGVDSFIKEKKETKQQSKKIYKAIKELNAELGKTLLQAMDA
jgi:CRISPR/Cas system CSM-associated protein Csm2 small subunit